MSTTYVLYLLNPVVVTETFPQHFPIVNNELTKKFLFTAESYHTPTWRNMPFPESYNVTGPYEAAFFPLTLPVTFYNVTATMLHILFKYLL